jgi:hypothetical protein
MKKCLQVKKPVSCVDFLAEEGMSSYFDTTRQLEFGADVMCQRGFRGWVP